MDKKSFLTLAQIQLSRCYNPDLLRKKFWPIEKMVIGYFWELFGDFSDDLKLPKMSKKFPKSSSKLGTLYDEFLLTFQYEKSSRG
jgi:hypothetical protein